MGVHDLKRKRLDEDLGFDNLNLHLECLVTAGFLKRGKGRGRKQQIEFTRLLSEQNDVDRLASPFRTGLRCGRTLTHHVNLGGREIVERYSHVVILDLSNPGRPPPLRSAPRDCALTFLFVTAIAAPCTGEP
jgi:hypothetical protein